jgi:hemoglobin/transferrin/lactoferrin receptor protein
MGMQQAFFVHEHQTKGQQLSESRICLPDPSAQACQSQRDWLQSARISPKPIIFSPHMHRTLPLSLCLSLLSHAALHCAEPAKELPAIIVTAAAREEPLADAPYTAHEVARERIAEMQPQSFPEALKEIPGIFIQQTAHGQGSPFIRGFTGFRNLAMIDGIRLNNSVFREGPNQYWSLVDSLSLDSIEVVKGQGSVLYGSDAIGGVVNAITQGPIYLEPEPPAPASPKSPKNITPTAPAPVGPYVTGGTSVRYATAENSWTARLQGSVSEWKKYGLHVGVTGSIFGDLRAADLGTLPQTSYDELGVDVKYEHYLSDDVKLTVAHNQFHQDDVWRTHRTIYAVPFSGSTVGNEFEHFFDQDRYLTYLRLEGDADGAVDHFRVTVSHHRLSEDLYRFRSDRSRSVDSFEVDTWGIEAVLESETAIGHLTYGLSYYLDVVDAGTEKISASGKRSNGIQGPVADSSLYHLASGFIQDEIALSDRVDLTLGGRYTYAAADVGRFENPETGKAGSFIEDWHDVSGSARVMFKADEAGKLRFFTGVSQSFRAPNLSDLSRLDTARSNEIETAAPGLDPEKFLTGEVGVRWEGDNASLGLAYFYTDISDMIVRSPTGRTLDGLFEVTKKNAGDGHVQGIEFGGHWQFHRDWRVFGSLAWQDGQVDGFPNSTTKEETEPLSRLLPITGLAGLRWDSPERRFWVEGLVQIVDRQDRLSAGDLRDTQRIPPGGTPGYTVATLRSGWNVNDKVTVTAAVENFTDESYRIHGSGVNEPGVNFIFGAQVRF